MQLKLEKRDIQHKREAKRVRREGKIPACLYTSGKQSEPVMVDSAEFGAILRHIPRGQLPTTIFTLVDGAGKQRRAIVKDIQYHITTYDVIHLDFEELFEDVPVDVKVPIECTGVVDCQGIKLGGFLRPVIRHVKVRCLPKDIPTSFKVDIRDMKLKESRRLRDIQIPETVRPLIGLDEVAFLIAKR